MTTPNPKISAASSCGTRFREALLRTIQATAAEDARKAVARIKADVFAWRGRDLFDDDVSLSALQAK